MFKYLLMVTSVGVVWTIWPLTFVIPFWLLVYPGFLWIAWVFHKDPPPFGLSDENIDSAIKASDGKTVEEHLADSTVIRDIGAEA